MRAGLERLGMPGVAGVGLLLFCLAFQFGSLAPLARELDGLEAEKARLAAAVAAGGTGPLTVAGLPLRPFAEAPELLKLLNTLAEKHGVAVERATYAVKGKEGPLRLEVGMPLKVAYPALRAYLREALALPAAALEELTLQRSLASDPLLAAQVRLSYGFTRTP